MSKTTKLKMRLPKMDIQSINADRVPAKKLHLSLRVIGTNIDQSVT